MRWERLEGVLRELDELRDRGEKTVTGRRSSVDVETEPEPDPEAGRGSPDGSALAQADRGDALRPQVEAPLDGGDRTAP